MNRVIGLTIFFILTFLACVAVSRSSFGQEVTAGISSREAYVGSPIVLQIQIENAKNYSLPDMFEVEGCDVEAAGAPSQSSQIMIFNGRRTESRTVTMHYRITPREAGQFEIPALKVDVDGETKSISPFKFVATASEMGDLMFVEIEGKQKKVYVGEPLGLTMKLWIKPFRDREKNIKLNEGRMWQMLSDSSRWGPFVDRMKELSENRQRPGGNPVLRDNGHGEQLEYFLYEIEATIYPTRTGKIDGGDVQMVVNYPLELGRSRDPFDSVFGGRSLMKQMMDDDFFGGSPFGRRMSITKARPIVANASVDSTEVLPVPTIGKPADYRGAVGRYRIVTQAEPNVVDAGDPVTLRIGIIGDGPMDLVQAPPLADIDELNSNFMVVDQSLAGFVQDDTKVFITSIRPRSTDVTEIPAIPFSFFDPAKEAYETVYSAPIPLTVNEAETLSLDSIVGNSASSVDLDSHLPKSSMAADLPDLTNSDSMQSPSQQRLGPSFPWFYFAVVPPVVAILVIAVRWLTMLIGSSGVSVFRSAEKQALMQLRAAKTSQQIRDSLVGLIARNTRQRSLTESQAAGALRLMGLTAEANRFESLIAQLDRMNDTSSTNQLKELFSESAEFVSAVVPVMTRSKSKAIRSKRGGKRMLQKSTAVLLLWLTACSSLMAEDSLSRQQLESVFAQANETYQRGREVAVTDQAESKIALQSAVRQYQMLVDQGVSSAGLYLNLANAQMQNNQLGHAIANYHRALQIDSGLTQATRNLQFAQQKLVGQQQNDNAGEAERNNPVSRALFFLVNQLGSNTIGFVFAFCSIVFWLLVAIRGCGVKFPILKYGSLLFAIAVLAGVLLYFGEQQNEPFAIAVVDTLELREGDGDEFKVARTVKNATGRKLAIMGQRGGWVQVANSEPEDSSDSIGWVHHSQVEQIRTNRSKQNL